MVHGRSSASEGDGCQSVSEGFSFGGGDSPIAEPRGRL